MMDSTPDLSDAVRDCHPVDDVTQVPWPDFHGCPYRPYGRFGYWLVFEESHEQQNRARKRVYLTVKQVRDGNLDALEISYDLLDAWFPEINRPVGFRARDFDRRRVADWLFFHVNNAETARLNRYEARLRAAGRWPEPPAQACAKAAPAQAPAAAEPPQAGVTLSLSSGRDRKLELRTVHVRPSGDGGAVLVVTIHPPWGDDFAVATALTSQQRDALVNALSAC